MRSCTRYDDEEDFAVKIVDLKGEAAQAAGSMLSAKDEATILQSIRYSKLLEYILVLCI